MAATNEKLDFVKQYRDIYNPPKKPTIIQVPEMRFIAVAGQGVPGSPAYQEAISLFYTITFTIKMSKMSGDTPPGYQDYKVPPLEGLWWQAAGETLDLRNKEQFFWRSLMRLPDYVDEDIYSWAVDKARAKKPELNYAKAQYLQWAEGLCCQCLHMGPYDDEPATIANMHAYLEQNGYQHHTAAQLADGTPCAHHEIYLNDPRRCKPERIKTILRLPVCR